MRISSIAVTFTALLSLFSSATAIADYDINEGLWEITVKVEIEGMSMSMPPITNTQCITKKTLGPKSNQQNQECKIINQKIEGDTISYDIECSGPSGSMKGHGKVTYTGDTMTGTMEMNTPSQGNMKMITKMSGKRIGPCK
jgi:hypothetical protein